MKRIIGFCIVLAGLLGGSDGRADTFLNLTTLTPGGPGTGAFTGTLGSIVVTGTVSGTPAVFTLNGTGPLLGDSTIDGTSPQYSYSTVYNPTAATTDRLGFTYVGGATNVVSFSFSSPVTNPIFHVANIDSAQFTFVATAGLTSMTLLNGNGGSGDGIFVIGSPSFSIVDANGSTADATSPGITPPVAGARSAYGSVQLSGTFSTITMGVGQVGPLTDSGSFTISVVPEPSSLILIGVGALGLAGFSRRRGRGTGH